MVILPDLKIQGVPKKMSRVIFAGITSLYLIKGSIFLQWVEKQSYYINRSIYLTKISPTEISPSKLQKLDLKNNANFVEGYLPT